MTTLVQRISEIRGVSRLPRFLQARIDAEKSACRLLAERAGYFTEEDFSLFLDLCNTEVVPPTASSNTLRASETRTRFQQSFIGQNRCLMLDALEKCNDLLGRLWNADRDQRDILDSFWQHSGV